MMYVVSNFNSSFFIFIFIFFNILNFDIFEILLNFINWYAYLHINQFKLS